MNVRTRGLLAVVFTLLATAPLAAQGRIGYVDTRKILQEMPGRQQVEAKLNADVALLGTREKKMADSLQAMLAAFEKDSSAMTVEDRTKRFTAMQQYDALYRDTLQALQAEAQQIQAEAMQPLFDLIKIALDEVRAADGLAAIFDVGSQSNSIVAMDKNLDLSDKVIARLRTTARPVASPTTRPNTPAPAPAAAKPAGPVSQPAGVTRKP